MKEMLKAIVPSIVVGVFSTLFTASVMVTRLEERVVGMEKDMQKHELLLDRQLQRQEASVSDLAKRTDDQERRLSRTETTLESMGAVLLEIKGDVKTLLRSKP